MVMTVGVGGTGNSSESTICWSLSYTWWSGLSRQAGKSRGVKTHPKAQGTLAPGWVWKYRQSELSLRKRVDCWETGGSFSNCL